MTSAVTKYKIYCETESKYVDGWLSTGPPTVCFNNNTHTVNANSVQVVEVIPVNEVKIKEDSVYVARNVLIKSIEFSGVESNTSQSIDYKFDLITSMYSFKFVIDDTNKGDSFTIAINPDTIMGYIGANISAGATSIIGSTGLLLYGWAGFHIKLSDGTNTDDVGYILSINKDTGVVTFSTPTTHSFLASNTIIKMTYYVMNNILLGPPGNYVFGEDVVGGAAVPIGTTVRFTYKNNTIAGDLTDEPKSMIMYLTLLF